MLTGNVHSTNEVHGFHGNTSKMIKSIEKQKRIWLKQFDGSILSYFKNKNI